MNVILEAMISAIILGNTRLDGINRDYITTINSNQHTTFVLGDSVDTIQKREAENQRRIQEERDREARVREMQAKMESSASAWNIEPLYQDDQVGYNCVAFARTKGFEGTGFAHAGNIKTDIEIPRAGLFAVTYESWRGHIVWVESVAGDYMTILESNAKPGWVNRRVIKWKDNSKIKGFLKG